MDNHRRTRPSRLIRVQDRRTPNASARKAARDAVLRATIVAACTLAPDDLHARDVVQSGLRFDSPAVLDLAEHTQDIANASAVPVVALGATNAKEILVARTLDEEHPAWPFSDEEYACTPPSATCSRAQEQKRMDATGGTVRRNGKRLTVTPSAGAPAIFVDWKAATTRTADGDEAAHSYLGRLPGSGYHRIEVRFGHDAPGSFLVNPDNGNVTFVHNGSDVVVPAPDGLHLVTFNSMNPPLSLRIAELDANGARLALTCTVAQDGPATVQFKGWRDAHSFDLALLPAGIRGEEEVIALHMARDARGWSVAASDRARLATLAFSCRQRSR
jgi:hypothetical protein